jgi:hypothetical protein
MKRPKGIYEDYKPFRNWLRRLDRLQGLIDIWCYSQHVMEGRPLPADYAIGLPVLRFGPLKEHVRPWDLDVLAREIVLNAGSGGGHGLKNWADLATALDHIHRLEGIAFERGDEGPPDVLYELHRIAHRQFPWQIAVAVNPMMRVFKVFGQVGVEAIVVRELGMTALQFLQLGMALRGNFQRRWGISTNKDYAVLGISRESSGAFLRRITCTLDELKEDMAARQSYGSNWLYAWNPLEAWPLVSFDRSHPDRVLCPIPYHLARRASIGIFYDLVKAADFDNPFGNSFQAYVGEIIGATCEPPRFSLLAEEPYRVGSRKMHGVDWVLSDATGHLFIESKTKRLTVVAKTLGDPAALDKDLSIMATAIVQHYRNIRDALDGKTRWVPDGRPVYPIILTLEDWFMFSPRVHEVLTGHVRRLLSEAAIPEHVLEDMPYTIGSAHEFEATSQIIAEVGIASVFSAKTAPEERGWSLLPFVANHFREEMGRVNGGLFVNDFATLLPHRPESS